VQASLDYKQRRQQLFFPEGIALRSTFALRASVDNLRVACQPKLTRTVASVSEGW
jgi:hypothetical protein